MAREADVAGGVAARLVARDPLAIRRVVVTGDQRAVGGKHLAHAAEVIAAVMIALPRGAVPPLFAVRKIATVGCGVVGIGAGATFQERNAVV